MKATVRLFKALPITSKLNPIENFPEIHKKTIPYGFVFSQKIFREYPETILNDKIEEIASLIGISGKEVNSSFHKSWVKVSEASIEQLVIEQIIHYLTTYGFEALGITDGSIYIPVEALNISEIGDGFNLTIIDGLTPEEIKEKSFALCGGIALSQETVDDITEIFNTFGIVDEEIAKIKNKEVRIALYDKLGRVPKDPTEFLRYLIYKTTGKTLLIKDPETIMKLKIADPKIVNDLFDKYMAAYGLKMLSEVFYRFKPIFLAFKKSGLSYLINRIRRLAKIHHKPMKQDCLNEVTSNLGKIDIDQLNDNLDKANIFRKIRLAYALKFRTGENVDSILYKIRNGKSYSAEFSFDKQIEASKILDFVLGSIGNDLEHLKGKKVYIPDNIRYALPATEKQFTGHFPSGTYITIPQDMIIGVCWENVDSNRIDLDLSLVSIDGKYGWDSYYRDSNRKILFSGDMTDASNGASELFYVKSMQDFKGVVYLNYYNHDPNIPVPFKILVAQEVCDNFGKSYMVDPNNILVSVGTEIGKQRQKVLGMLIVKCGESRFYFSESYLGDRISSGAYCKQVWKYFNDFYSNPIDFNDVLVLVGAELSSKEECDIDLSPDKIDKTTFLDLLQKKA